jgi:cyclopropane-fatty-acyl-phospholipid synthase
MDLFRMSIPPQRAASNSYSATIPSQSPSLLAALLRRILPRLDCGQLVINTAAGERLVFEGTKPGPQARINIYSWKVVWRVATRGGVGFAESYIAGEWSSPALGSLLSLVVLNSEAAPKLSRHIAPRLLLKIRHSLNRNTKRGSRRNIAAHYDLGNDFYSQWLDKSMSYSAALFSSTNQSLEEAQSAKIERVFELLELSGGERVLEIGCGWGGLAERIIESFHCKVTGLTLSVKQLEFARKRLRDNSLLKYADLRLQDYRDVRGSYDRVVSIEMLEAVGAGYWPIYFEKLRDALRPGGIAVLQVITIDESRYENYRRRPDFIQKHIFPGGMLPTKAILNRCVATAGLELVATECFGSSYARTLADWQRRFQQAWPTIEGLGFDNRFKRTWEYYLAYCQAGFETATVDVGLYKISRAARK